MKKTTTILNILSKTKAITSLAEGRRAVIGNGVKLNGFPVKRFDLEHDFFAGDIIQFGTKKKIELQESDLVE